MDQIREPELWTKYLPGLPTAGEVAVLILMVAALIGGGSLIKRWWSRSNETMPFPVALMLWVGMFAIYLTMAANFYKTVDPHHQTTILAWCFIFWVIPVAYYTFTVVNSFATRAVDHIGPFSAHIEEPSEFAAARKLALRGDIDGAISMYRNYRDNQVNALFEAARLLRSEDRYFEAATLFEEIAQRFVDQGRVWAEAMYQLARLKEAHLGGRGEAVVLLKEIIKRAPEGRFAQLASADIARLHILERAQAADKPGDRDQDAPAAARPKKPAEAVAQEEGEEKAAVPQRDPFYVPRKEDAPAEPAEGAAAKPPAKKPAAKKKAAPSKKRPAK